MVIYEHSRVLSTGGSLLGHVSELAYRIAAAVADWRGRRSTRKALSRLSDEQLDDIGLTRADIDTLR